MKKISLLCLMSFSFTHIASAGGVNAPVYDHHVTHQLSPRHFQGFSVTGALGGLTADLGVNHYLNSSATATEAPDSLALIDTQKNDLNLSSDSFVGYIGLDYAYQWQSGFLLGVGVTAGFDNLNFLNTGVTVSNFGTPIDGEFARSVSVLKTELENDFAILFKPGFVVRHNTLIYALVGPRWGNIESSVDDEYSFDFGVFGPRIEFKESGSASASGYKVGVTAGVGIQQMVAEHIKLGLEYDFTFYGDLDTLTVVHSRSEIIEETSVDILATNSYKDITLETHAIMATLSYQF